MRWSCGAGPGAAARPDPCQCALLADARLILKPDFERLAPRRLWQHVGDRSGEFSLEASCASGSASGAAGGPRAADSRASSDTCRRCARALPPRSAAAPPLPPAGSADRPSAACASHKPGRLRKAHWTPPESPLSSMRNGLQLGFGRSGRMVRALLVGTAVLGRLRARQAGAVLLSSQHHRFML